MSLEASKGSSTIRYNVVSSANSLILQFISDTISFIKTKTNKGPNISFSFVYWQ